MLSAPGTDTSGACTSHGVVRVFSKMTSECDSSVTSHTFGLWSYFRLLHSKIGLTA